jgi:hypothetical protein
MALFENHVKVLDRREGIIKMMQQPLPFLVLAGLTKPDCVIFKPAPFHKQQVLIGFFDAPVQFVRDVSGRCRYYLLSIAKCAFETLGLPSADLQQSNFEDQFRFLPLFSHRSLGHGSPQRHRQFQQPLVFVGAAISLAQLRRETQP